MSDITIEQLRQKISDFAAARDWDQFHSPKSLSMAMIVEAAELVEHFQWLTEEQSQSLPDGKCAEVENELADIFIYLIRMADKLDIDLLNAANNKLKINAEKYPADKVRGSAKKYTEY